MKMSEMVQGLVTNASAELRKLTGHDKLVLPNTEQEIKVYKSGYLAALLFIYGALMMDERQTKQD